MTAISQLLCTNYKTADPQSGSLKRAVRKSAVYLNVHFSLMHFKTLIAVSFNQSGIQSIFTMKKIIHILPPTVNNRKCL